MIPTMRGRDSEPRCQAGNESERFTPGPWEHKVIGSSDDNRIVYCLIGPERALNKKHGVAYTGTYGKTSKLNTAGIRLTDDECQANAHLLSAAPDLFNVARTCAELYDETTELGRVARAALSKARGESA